MNAKIVPIGILASPDSVADRALVSLMRDFIGNEGLFEAYTNDFNNMYSWLEYEFTSGEGKHYAGITDVQHQEILPPPKVFVSYEIQPQGTDTDLYKLKVNVTNVGEGPAKGIVIFAPDIFISICIFFQYVGIF